MTPFIVAALLLTTAVVALLTWPFYRAHDQAVEVDAARLNASLLDEEFAALDRERAAGTLDEAAHAQARDDLSRRLLDEHAMHAAAPLRAGRPMLSFAAIALGVPLVAGLLYATRGTPQALLPGAATAAVSSEAGGQGGANGAPGATAADVAKMVESLSAKLTANPDNPEGWAMLARSYSVMGRYDDAVKAYGRIGPKLEQNAGWLAQYADAIAMQAGGNPMGQPEALSLKALKLDPDNVLALMMAAYGAAARGDFDATIPLAEHALKLVPPDSEDQRFLQDLLGKARGRQAVGGAAATGPSGATGATPEAAGTPATAAAPAAADPTSLSVEVDIAPSLRSEARGRVLFVIARAPGQRMPLAVVRRIPEAWPLRVSLDAQSTLDPQRPLSGVPQVEIEARLSATGTPQSAPGDLLATTQMATGRTLSGSITIDHRRE